MKIYQLLAAISLVVTINLHYTLITMAQTNRIQVNPSMEKDPIVLQGNSGGSRLSKCGYLPNSPNYVMQIAQALPYLRLTIESTGKPTLLVDGPGGQFCVLTDNYTGGKPELSGYWPPGKYSIYIGESSTAHYSYSLSISQHRK